MTGRVLPCTDENNGSLTIWFRISSQHTRRGNPKRKSAKIELCVIRLISLIESFCRSHDRRNRLKIGRTCAGLRAGTDYEWSDFVSTVAVSDANFSVPARTERPGSTTSATTTTRDFRTVFNGEFDSGSERTLAAWIRHASRTRFLSVARQEEV
jgi:hypothetical protein